ncbi:MAG: hypothetical protein KBG30_13875 [Bacteroidales bacterium]|nr:hypothetical protein [Bacteroidales bacterium]
MDGIVNKNKSRTYTVSYDFIHYDIPTKIVLCRYIEIKMKENNWMTVANNPLNGLLLVADLMEEAFLQVESGETIQQEELQLRQYMVDTLLKKIAATINQQAKGNAQLIHSMGFKTTSV